MKKIVNSFPKLVCQIMFLCMQFQLHGQSQYKSIYYDESNGLPRAYYFQCGQDRNNMMIFAGEPGLFKFDGKHANYIGDANKLNDPVYFFTQLSDITFLCNIRNTVHYFNGVEYKKLFDRKSRKIVDERMFGSLSPDGNIYFTGRLINTVYKYIKEDTLESIDIKNLFLGQFGIESVSTIFQKGGLTYALTNRGFFCSKNNQVIDLKIPFTYTNNYWIHNELYITSMEKGLTVVNDLQCRQIEELKNERIFCAASASNGQAWVVGKNLYLLKNDKIEETIPLLFGSLVYEWVWEDNSGQIWLASNKGIIKFTKQQIKQSSFPSGSKLFYGLNRQEPCFLDSQNILNTPNRKQYKIDSRINTIADIKETNDGFYCAGLKNGLLYINKINGEAKLIKYESELPLECFGLFLLKNDTILSFSATGPMKLLKGNIIQYPKEKVRVPISCMVALQDGSFLVGTAQGLRHYSENFHYQTLQVPEFDETIRFLLKNNKNGEFWIVLENNKLYKFNYSKRIESIVNLSEKFPEIGNKFISITQSDEGIVALLTPKGTFIFSHNSDLVNFINNSQMGLSAKNLAYQITHTNEKGFHLFSENGTIEFESNLPRKQDIATYIKNIKFSWTENKKEFNKILTYPKLEVIKLPYNTYNLEIEFSSIYLGDHSDLLFQYDFNNSGNWKNIAYTTLNLPINNPGRYELKFRTKRIGGNWGKPAEYIFYVASPWYKTISFYFLIALATLVILVFFIRKYIKDKEKIAVEAQLKAEMLQEVAEFELIALKSQIEPHFVQNLFTLLHNKIVSEKSKEEISNVLIQLSRWFRDVMELSSELNHSVTAEIEFLTKYLNLKSILTPNLFQYKIEIEKEGMNPDDILLPTLVVQPFVENAIKYAFPRENASNFVLIKFELVQNYIKINITDNGIGTDIKSAKYSKSLDITKKRLLLALGKEAKISIESTNGTSVTIVIPHTKKGSA